MTGKGLRSDQNTGTVLDFTPPLKETSEVSNSVSSLAWCFRAVFVHITKRVYPFRCKLSEVGPIIHGIWPPAKGL